MGRMADLDAELHELPDEAKDFMQGFYRGRAEGILIGQEEGAVVEQERIIKLIKDEIKRVTTPVMVDKEYLDGLGQAISLIKGEAVEPKKTKVHELPKPRLRCGVNGCGCDQGEVN